MTSLTGVNVIQYYQSELIDGLLTLRLFFSPSFADP